jgi:uncharacterized protein
MRPHKTRRICHRADVTYFKPQGIPMRDLQEVVLPLDCLEAIRLADVEGLYHQEASEQMGVSRATFGRILERGRALVAAALINGAALRIGGGAVEHVNQGRGRGRGCGRGPGCGRGQRRGPRASDETKED